jgi:hypothetical protein
MTLNKTTILSMAMGIGFSILGNAQTCTWPTNQILPNGDFECNDYGANPPEYGYLLYTLHANGWFDFDQDGLLEPEGDDNVPVPPSNYGWHQYSPKGAGGQMGPSQVYGYNDEVSNTFDPIQGSAAVKIGYGSFLYRATDPAKSLDPTKYYKISAWVREVYFGGNENHSFSTTANPLAFSFNMTKINSSNLNGVGFEGPCVDDNYCIPYPAVNNIQVVATSDNWHKIESDYFQVSETGQYWFSVGYRNVGWNFSGHMYIDDILLEEACPGFPPVVGLGIASDHACAADVSVICQTSMADAHVFLTYETDAAGNITGPAYTTNWFSGNLNQFINFADLTFSAVNSSDPVFPGYMPGNYYGVKVGAGNCSGIWADDATTVYINSNNSPYFYPTATQSDATALLRVGNYGGSVDTWQISYDVIPTIWTDLSNSAMDEYTATGITSKRHYRAKIVCGNGEYFSNYRTLDGYSAPGGGRRTPISMDSDKKYILNPNPANSEISIQTNGVGSLAIYNALGQLMTTIQTADMTEITLDISKWTEGVYIVRWNEENNSTTQRFIKE